MCIGKRWTLRRMIQMRDRRSNRAGAIHWSAIAFLVVFACLALAVAYFTIRPGAAAASDATVEEKRQLVAWFRLLLAVLLFILFAGLAVTFRFGRLLFPRPSSPRVKTQYVDAWAESAKRVEVPPDEKDGE